MKSAPDMLDDRLRIQSGHFKGATVTLSRESIIELMEDYARQYQICASCGMSLSRDCDRCKHLWES